MDEFFGLFNNIKTKFKKVSSINDVSTLIILTRRSMDSGDLLGALGFIKRLLAMVKTCEERNNCYYVMSRLYADLHMFEMSVNCGLRLLKNCTEEAVPFAHFVLGASFLGFGDMTAARYYLNNCLNSSPNREITDSAMECMERIDIACGHRYKVVGGTEFKEEVQDDDLRKANLLLAAGQNEEALQKLTELNDKNTFGASSSLALCHFFMGDVKKAIDVTNSARKLSVFDQCNLIIFYDSLLDFKSQQRVIDELALKHNMTCEEYLKLGITFAQIKRNDLVMKYLGTYLKYVDCDPEILLFYAIACLNCCEKERAKEMLLKAQTLDMANSYVYNYYLNVAHFGMKHDLEYVIDVQAEERSKITKCISDLMTKSAAEMKKQVNMEFLDYVVRHDDIRGRGAFLLKACTDINTREMDIFLDGILLDLEIPASTKYMLLRSRMNLLRPHKFGITINSIYNCFDLKVVREYQKLLDEEFKEAVILAQMYIVQQEMGGDVSLKIEKADVERYLAQKIRPNKYAMAAVLAYGVCEKTGVTPKKLSRHFMIKEEEFWNTKKIFEKGIEIV
ncbi:MAG: hypothetical protein LBN07_03430 [Christensenellaceae bacterium]|jgi:tetratricopeptide (TPR) repeat protein|nr:hypothetical protein [Christensenellaceae bacterium]